MKGQPNRLATSPNHPFSGAAIDRSRALTFALNGRKIHGFVGDTVLSAVLANGIDMVGMHRGSAIGLSTRCAPPILLPGDAGSQLALPMDRTPARDGIAFTTLQAPQRNVSHRIRNFLGTNRSLDLNLDTGNALHQPWLSLQGQTGAKTDVVVVGGGIAGMAAALAAAKAGKRVTLVEAAPHLGGHARLFGTQEGEDTPDQNIARLTDKIAANDAITVCLRASAFAIRPGLVRIHLIDVTQPNPISRVVDCPAGSIVLATGSTERLPIFAGNRLPGVSGTLEAFELAYRYGVWTGRTALFATTGNPAYRLAMATMDAGIKVARIEDARTAPESRFIAFSRAYGISQATGVTIGAVKAGRGSTLKITPELSIGELHSEQTPIEVDRVVTSGGWQPELTLWTMAGGTSLWDADAAILKARIGPSGIALAGSVAGYQTQQACIASGRDAVQALLGKTRVPFEDRSIDPVYETPDAPTPISTSAHAHLPAYLDGGCSLTAKPQVARKRRPKWRSSAKERGPAISDFHHALGMGDIAACVQLGLIPPDCAGEVASERIVRPFWAEGVDAAVSLQRDLTSLPSYLRFRHGPDNALWLIAASEPGHLEPGAQLHGQSDMTAPQTAIGVVVRPVDGGAIALLDASCTNMGTAFVRLESRAVQVRFVEPYTADMDLAAALGGGTRPS